MNIVEIGNLARKRFTNEVYEVVKITDENEEWQYVYSRMKKYTITLAPTEPTLFWRTFKGTIEEFFLEYDLTNNNNKVAHIVNKRNVVVAIEANDEHKKLIEEGLLLIKYI